MNINDRIIAFNEDRHIPKNFNLGSEAGHISEELSELLRSSTDDEKVDALCDIVVFATGALWKLGYEPTEAMNQTLLEIESRSGSFDQDIGKWVKDTSPEAMTLRYKADYGLAKA